MKRAHDLMLDRDLLKDELHHVQGLLRRDGYPKGFMRKYKDQCRYEKEEDDDDENKPLPTAKISYVKGLRR